MSESIKQLGPEPQVPPPSALLSLTEAQRALLEILTLNFSRKLLHRIAPACGSGSTISRIAMKGQFPLLVTAWGAYLPGSWRGSSRIGFGR